MCSRLSRRALLVLLVAALAATAARLAAPTGAHPTKVSRALFCGTERWYVKTLQDRPRLLRARKSAVAALASLPRPKPAPTDRIPFERRIYSVEAAVTHVFSEDDQDLHLVLEDGSAHMVAESPNAPSCTVNATAYRKKQMAAAREKIRLCSHARIVGVAFWDRPHNVTGRAPNSIELHPILGFACLAGS
jgi:hypothetical protein